VERPESKIITSVQDDPREHHGGVAEKTTANRRQEHNLSAEKRGLSDRYADQSLCGFQKGVRRCWTSGCPSRHYYSCSRYRRLVGKAQPSLPNKRPHSWELGCSS